MKITVITALMMFLAYFLVLYGGVGFIQDKRFFSSAPKENLQAIPDKRSGSPGRISLAGRSRASPSCCFSPQPP